MVNNELYRAFVFSIPLISALICLIMTFFDMCRPIHPARRRIDLRIITANGHLVFVWIGFVLFSIAHPIFVYGLPIFVPAIMAGVVSTYRLILTITDTGEKPRMIISLWHYLVPVIAYLNLLVVVFVFPYEQLENIIYSTDDNPVKIIMLIISIIYAVIYPIMGIREVARYRKAIKGEPDTRYRRMMGWLMSFSIMELVVLVPLVAGMLFSARVCMEMPWWCWIFAVLPSAAIYLMACYNLLSDNYQIVETDTPEGISAEDVASNEPRLNRARVIAYLDEKKPWLNPGFRITDMAEDLFSNRAYISAFINREFGMNFNRFINGYRLQEVKRLREEAATRKQKVSTLQLIMNAGFSSYRSYLRAKDGKGDTGKD